MSVKVKDDKGRWRSKSVAFRMSPEECEELNYRVQLSGLSKQDYLIKRSLEQNIVVIGNPRVYKALRNKMDEILMELKKISENIPITDELLDKTNQITTLMEGLSKKNSYPNG
ncbi:MAG: hypothetical protein JXN65_06560 [Clostridia bacterium]|nr:hypothetical protein [Clostridia bacterium]